MGEWLTQGAPESTLLLNLVFITLNAVLGSLMTKAYTLGRNLGGVRSYVDEMQKRRLISYSDDSNYCCRLREVENKGILRHNGGLL